MRMRGAELTEMCRSDPPCRTISDKSSSIVIMGVLPLRRAGRSVAQPASEPRGAGLKPLAGLRRETAREVRARLQGAKKMPRHDRQAPRPPVEAAAPAPIAGLASLPRVTMCAATQESALLARARGGDRQAYGALVELHFTRVYSLLYRTT